MEAVREDGCAVQFIDNPTEEVQLAAVRENEYALRYINNPTEEVQLEAVKQNGYIIEYIDNPSGEVQLAAVRENGCALRYINNPTDYIKHITDVLETSYRLIYVLHEEGKEPLFSIGCQKNISKEYFIWRIYNLDGGLEKNPHRQEYLDILERY